VVSDAQAGTLGEALFAAYCIWSTDGRLEAYRPLSDDDHRDFAVHRRHGFGTAYVQIKTAVRADHAGRVSASAKFPVNGIAEDDSFLYVVLYVGEQAAGPVIQHAWLIPSRDFNALSYREPYSRTHVQLTMVASTKHEDRWSRFAVNPGSLGSALLDRLANLPARATPVEGAFLLVGPR
jgi:hypothetical protein